MSAVTDIVIKCPPRKVEVVAVIEPLALTPNEKRIVNAYQNLNNFAQSRAILFIEGLSRSPEFSRRTTPSLRLIVGGAA